MDERGRDRAPTAREAGPEPRAVGAALGAAGAAVGGAAAVFAATALAVVPAGLEAQQDGPPLVTDRPDFTESAVAVSPGRVQLEAGYTFTREGDTRAHDLGEALFRIGVVPAVELRAGLSSFTVRDPEGRPSVSGFGDASLGAKVALTEEARSGAPRAALLVGTTLPTGGERFGSDGAQPGATLALGWDLPGDVGVGANVGYTRGDGEAGRFDELSASGAVSLPLSGAAGVYVEYFGLYRDAGPEDENFVNGGLTYRLGPDLQLDGRVGLGLDGPGPDYFAGLGVSIRR